MRACGDGDRGVTLGHGLLGMLDAGRVRNPHAAQQVCEAGIRAQVGETVVPLHVHEPGGTLEERPLEPLEGLVVVSEAAWTMAMSNAAT